MITETVYLCFLLAGHPPACHRQLGPHVTHGREACERAFEFTAKSLKPGERQSNTCRIVVERREV